MLNRSNAFPFQFGAVVNYYGDIPSIDTYSVTEREHVSAIHYCD